MSFSGSNFPSGKFTRAPFPWGELWVAIIHRMTFTIRTIFEVKISRKSGVLGRCFCEKQLYENANLLWCKLLTSCLIWIEKRTSVARCPAYHCEMQVSTANWLCTLRKYRETKFASVCGQMGRTRCCPPLTWSPPSSAWALGQCRTTTHPGPPLQSSEGMHGSYSSVIFLVPPLSIIYTSLHLTMLGATTWHARRDILI